MAYLPGQKNIEVEIRPAKQEELGAIVRKAGVLELDIAETDAGQFLVAVRGDSIRGFGRLRPYRDFTELATLGVMAPDQMKGIGSLVVRALLKKAGGEVYLTTVIPAYFSRFGFSKADDYPAELNKKMDFCRSFGFHAGEIFVMKHQP
jgi:N-acetylglutamate synthase-like GNAT family acetyltransferase